LFIHIPRTRYTDFKPFVLAFLKYSQEQVNELVLKLYTKGLTTRDVSDVLENFFGEEMSYAQVSNLAERFHEPIFRTRDLK
jgi:putative transposase